MYSQLKEGLLRNSTSSISSKPNVFQKMEGKMNKYYECRFCGAKNFNVENIPECCFDIPMTPYSLLEEKEIKEVTKSTQQNRK